MLVAASLRNCGLLAPDYAHSIDGLGIELSSEELEGRLPSLRADGLQLGVALIYLHHRLQCQYQMSLSVLKHETNERKLNRVYEPDDWPGRAS